MTDLRSKALSPVVAAIILIVIIVAVSIAVAAWMGALTFTFMASDLESRVDARIYSTENNIGVLNEDGIFDVAVKNYANKTRTINIVIDAGEHILYNETVAIEPLSSKSVNITQRLVFLGTWTIELYEGKKVIGGYSFVTELNEAEAEMRITQLHNIRLNTTLSIVAIIVSTLSVIVSIAHVMYARKQFMKSRKAEDRKAGKSSPANYHLISRKTSQTLTLLSFSVFISTLIALFVGGLSDSGSQTSLTIIGVLFILSMLFLIVTVLYNRIFLEHSSK